MAVVLVAPRRETPKKTAAAVELWRPQLAGAVVAIGNAPTALFHLLELVADNKTMAAAMRKAHETCDQHGDVGTASLLETFIDATERRTWFLFEASRDPDASGH